MKRLAAMLIILTMILALFGCQKDDEVSSTATPTPLPDAGDEVLEDDVALQITIGFSLAGEGVFYDQLITDINAECTENNFQPQILTATTPAQQESDVLKMLSEGAAVIVIDPVDVDALEEALSECELQSVPVINIIDQVNGTVGMLISPYYKTVGEKAGQYALDLLGESGGTCMTLNTEYDSFMMQLMSDGFAEVVSQDEDVTLADAEFCGEDEEEAYALTKQALSGETPVQFIFAESAALGRGALQAISETSAQTQLVVFGGDMDLIESVESGDIYAALFIGPGQLAAEAVYHANKYIIDAAYAAPQFDELTVDAVTAENAAQYISDTASHAQVISE